MFPGTMWNVYDRVSDNLPRTSNAVEGWYRAFQSGVGAHRISTQTLVGVLRRDY